jgi:hypothetical protein
MRPLRTSIRTMLLSVFFAGTAMMIISNWDPWKFHHTFPLGMSASFSPDSSKIVVACYQAKVVDLKTGNVIADIQADAHGYMDDPRWSTDGRWLYFQNDVHFEDTDKGSVERSYRLIWDAHQWTKDPVAELDETKRVFVPLPWSTGAGYGSSIPLPSGDTIWHKSSTETVGRHVQLRAGNSYFEVLDGESVVAIISIPEPIVSHTYFQTIMSEDKKWIVAYSGNANLAHIWSRRRPEKWWGIAWLPEFWFTAALACATICSLFYDQNIRNSAPVQSPKT